VQLKQTVILTSNDQHPLPPDQEAQLATFLGHGRGSQIRVRLEDSKKVVMIDQSNVRQ
jgi:hypothetical protein